jgi:hypothetical protein
MLEKNRRLAEHDAQRSRFAAPHAQRSEREALVNDALLAITGQVDGA